MLKPFPFPRRARLALLSGLLAVALVLAGSPAGAVLPVGEAVVVARERSGERTLDLTIDSPAVGARVKTRILLPPGFDDQPARTWPVIYLLHGCCNKNGGWDRWTALTDVAEITAGTEALIVMPEGGAVGYYSDWWNGGRGGPPAWETFHLGELPPLLAREVRAGPRRAVAGASMGGTGALEYAGRYPEFFRAAASYSGRLDTRLDAAAVRRRLVDHGHDPDAMWGDPVAQAGIWAAHNPCDVLRNIPAGFPVYVSNGDGTPGPLDDPNAPFDALEAQFEGMAEAYVDRARRQGVAVTAHLYGPGRHNYAYWEREFALSLPMLARAVGAATTVPAPAGEVSPGPGQPRGQVEVLPGEAVLEPSAGE
ncbi:alpha/beta hydrolase [Streptomyces litchfieldiae]|uniref:Alpha/beta hydrolase family protein n=1 Tax=Streptomyces litchfieldiae TaxID=3075543 RepID=A0ABU2MW20_9ACTN|nr:alpha/beta hydrolase family protein [Streptomyces sp. DSM 44938]MDT0345780.1 alpha/beta hydrolase family protein [Streptomyces sp. DSM 44938]